MLKYTIFGMQGTRDLEEKKENKEEENKQKDQDGELNLEPSNPKVLRRKKMTILRRKEKEKRLEIGTILSKGQMDKLN